MKKACSKCGREKFLEEFYLRSANRGGVDSECKACKMLHTRRRRQTNPEKCAAATRRWRQANPEKFALTKRRWNLAHREKNAATKLRWKNSKYSSDLNFRLLVLCRSRILSALKSQHKSARTIELIGCSIESLKLWLSSNFKSGMSWENYGDWHIDHIRPCASFDLTNPDQQKECFHYTNLQPLWAEKNLQKGSKWPQTNISR